MFPGEENIQEAMKRLALFQAGDKQLRVSQAASEASSGTTSGIVSDRLATTQGDDSSQANFGKLILCATHY